MAKMTIYVPDDLKRRMDEAEGVNWSPLACHAFEQKLAETIKQRGVKTMNDTINRLKASKLAGDDKAYKLGFQAGTEWAKTTASAAELEKLAIHSGVNPREWDRVFDCDGTSDHCVAERLFVVITTDVNNQGDSLQMATFWQKVLGDYFLPRSTVPNSTFRGFADGALKVWDQVKDHL